MLVAMVMVVLWNISNFTPRAQKFPLGCFGIYDKKALYILKFIDLIKPFGTPEDLSLIFVAFFLISSPKQNHTPNCWWSVIFMVYQPAVTIEVQITTYLPLN